jgi:hypothetical protein
MALGWSAGREGVQPGDCSGDLGGPGPGRGDTQPQAPRAADQAPGGGEQAQPQPFGFPAAGFAFQGEHLHPGQQFAGHGHDLAPDLVLGEPVPLENAIRSGDLRVLGGSGGVSVFVDQAAQDGSSVDPCGAGVGHGGAGDVTVAAGDVLCDALVRPGGVVVRLIFRENGAQVRLAEDQRPVEDFVAQRPYEALAGRVHPVGCQNSRRASDLGFYPRRSCSFGSSTCP